MAAVTPLDFLRAVWPDEGYYCIATPFGKGWRHKVCDTIKQAARIADDCKDSHNVFFALFSLAERQVWDDRKIDYQTGQPGAYAIRTQANSLAIKCFFFDIDVGDDPKKYPDQLAALAALKAFCAETGLPRPVLTSSGGGVHVYWPLSEALPAAEWRLHAAKLKQLAVHHGLRIDPSRTTDSASVLRVPGTFNLKDPTSPRPVVLLTPISVSDTSALLLAISDAAIRCGASVPTVGTLAIPGAPPKGFEGIADNTGQAQAHPRPKAKDVLLACAQLQYVLRQRGAVDQSLWYHAIMVMRCTEEGDAAAHKISRGPSYDPAAVDAKLHQCANMGAAKCETLEKDNPGGCAGCLFKDKGKSPLFAARQTATLPPPLRVNPLGVTLPPVAIPTCPEGYARRPGSGVVRIASDGDGNDMSITILPYDFYPISRQVNRGAGREQIVWHAELPRSETKDIVFAAEAIYDNRKMPVVLSNAGLYPPPSTLPYVADYMSAYTRLLQQEMDAETQSSTLGWNEDHTEFTLPDKVLLPDGTAKPAALSVGAERSSMYVCKAGSLEEQVRLMRFYQNRAYVPHQLMILSSLAAPLFYMTGHHGVILHANGKSGAAKSTTLYAASALWGNPSLYPINGTKTGSTEKARNERVTTLSNLPVMVDEITHMPAPLVADLVMGITQPGHRLRLDTNGVERAAPGGVKSTIMLTTANASLHHVLSADNTAGTAGSMRVFEMHLALTRVHNKAEADEFLFGLADNHGHIAEAFMSYVVQNRAAVQLRVREWVKRIDLLCQITPPERFWSAEVAVAIVAGEIARELGLLDYDVQDIVSWFQSVQLPQMRGTVHEEYSDSLGILTDYLEQINGQTLIAQKMDGAMGMTNVLKHPQGALLAHFDRHTMTMWVMKKGFADYCRKIGANDQLIVTELAQPRMSPEGQGKRIITNRRIRKMLGAGTDIGKAQSWCLQIDMSHPELTGVVTNDDVVKTPAKGKLKVIP